MAREKKLREVLNLRLDAPLAKEIRRLAQGQGRSESEVARTLLGYGAEVERRLEAQRLASAPRPDGDEFDRFPCIRCARALGKMQWIRQYPQSPWFGAAGPHEAAPPERFVALGYARRSAQPA